MRNKIAGTCYRCAKHVPIGAGFFERHQGGWRVQHVECSNRHADKERRLTAKLLDTYVSQKSGQPT